MWMISKTDIFYTIHKKTKALISQGADMNEGKKTVLIVDDEEMMLDIEDLMLQRIGYNTLKASNSTEACQLYKNEKEHIDLVVLDLIMPGENGTTTYKRLKRINPDIRVLISTGFGRDGNLEEILTDSHNGFIQKPFKFEELIKKIDAILPKNVS
jgi:DNA-binding NtrC family response regulator